MLATICLGTTMALLGVSLNIIQSGIQKASAEEAETTSYYARQVFQMNRIRYDGGWSNGISTRNQDAAFPANIWDMSYGRVVLNAAATSTYKIGLRYAAGTYPVKIFVNGVLFFDGSFPDNGWGNTVYDDLTNVPLNEGKNVFIVAILNWGVINEIIVPAGVTLLDEDTSGGVYLAGCSDLQNTYLSYTGNGVHDPEAFVYTSELSYDGNTSWRSNAKFDVAATASTKSVDLKYFCDQYTDGISELGISINGGAAYNLPVYETVKSVQNTVTIPTDVLTSHGFVADANTIEIFKPINNSEKIGLISLTLKDEEVASYSPLRNEAEDHMVVGGGGVLKGVGDLGNGNWSDDGFVGEMGTHTTLTSSSQIDLVTPNVNYISFTYAAASAGVYDVYIRYANGGDYTSYIRANQGSWVEVSLLSTSWWDNPRVAHVTLNMQQGNQTIVLTGTTNQGGWANYDYVDIIQKGTLSNDQIAYNYAVYFREQTSVGCTAQNVSLIPWSSLKSEYLAISSDAKDEFVDGTDETIADARARYQVLINRYPALAADNWLIDGEDNIVFAASSNYRVMNEQNPSLWVLVGFTIVLISSLGLLFISMRRRKVNY